MPGDFPANFQGLSIEKIGKPFDNSTKEYR